MKTCYRHRSELYLLAHIIKEGSIFQQPCKTLISPGESPTITRATGEFLRRCGWLAPKAASSENDREIAIAESSRSSHGAAELIHCKLVVGSCQLSTVLHVVEDAKFSDETLLSRWHIHIGSKDFEGLQRNAWDRDICYLSGSHEPCQYGTPPTCPLSCKRFTDALSNGHPDCLTYWHSVKVMNTVQFMVPREKGRCSNADSGPYYCSECATAEVLMYLHDMLEIQWGARTCAAVAKAGRIERLSYAHASGCPWDASTCAEAAKAERIECLSYAHAFGCPWDASTCAEAAKAGRIDSLMYAHASGCPWNSNTCALAAAHGKLDCLAYAHEHGCAMDTPVLHYAARNGQLECLKYAHTHGCPYDAVSPYSLSCPPSPPIHLTTQAVCASSIPCLRYVHKAMGCAWDTGGSECITAFQRGDIVLLRYIHKHGGKFCTDIGLLCPYSRIWLNAGELDAEKKANCLLYVYSYGGCMVKKVWQTRVGKLAVEMWKARRVAVLLNFYTAGKVHGQGPAIAAAHAGMHRMPSELLQKIIYTARLQVMV